MPECAPLVPYTCGEPRLRAPRLLSDLNGQRNGTGRRHLTYILLHLVWERSLENALICTILGTDCKVHLYREVERCPSASTHDLPRAPGPRRLVTNPDTHAFGLFKGGTAGQPLRVETRMSSASGPEPLILRPHLFVQDQGACHHVDLGVLPQRFALPWQECFFKPAPQTRLLTGRLSRKKRRARSVPCFISQLWHLQSAMPTLLYSSFLEHDIPWKCHLMRSFCSILS